MKKFIIAVLALTGFSVAAFAQAVPASKKAASPNMQVVKKHADEKTAKKAVAMHEVKTPAAKATVSTVAKKPVEVKKETKTVAAAKPAATTNSGTHLKKDGTPDKRFTAKTVTTGPVKKDGTADMRYKANKKHT